jgi:hypothetical protein
MSGSIFTSDPVVEATRRKQAKPSQEEPPHNWPEPRARDTLMRALYF